MYSNFRHPSHHTFLCRLHSSPFITKWILLEMCLVCLVYLPFLDIHTSYLISNIMRGTYYGTTYEYLFISSVLSLWNVLNSFLKYMLHYTHFQRYTVQLYLEHGYNNQLFHLGKTQFMNLWFWKYLDSPAIRNQRIPSIGSHTWLAYPKRSYRGASYITA